LFWLGGHFVEEEVGGGPHLLKLLHSLVNFAFQKRYKTLNFKTPYAEHDARIKVYWTYYCVTSVSYGG
jgi:hypothetical protein